MRRFGLDKSDFLDVIDGMAMDLAGDIRWPPFATLDLYCDRVASAVGRLSVRIFGMDDEPKTKAFVGVLLALKTLDEAVVGVDLGKGLKPRECPGSATQIASRKLVVGLQKCPEVHAFSGHFGPFRLVGVELP